MAQDEKKAARLYRLAAKDGYISALHNPGNCYYYGVGVKINYKKAAEFYSISAEADNHSLFMLGERYEYGRGVKKNQDEAVKCYSKAAEQGNKEAKKALARLGKL